MDNKKNHLYDVSVEFDESKLPQELKKYVVKLKEYDRKNDWLSYDMKFDEFEMRARTYLRYRKISNHDYKKIIAKYGWLYD